jgi:pyruvate-ferredoxin/flavodoxin oxidoreductase
MVVANRQIRERLKASVKEIAKGASGKASRAAKKWLASGDDGAVTRKVSEELTGTLKSESLKGKLASEKNTILQLKDYLVKKSIWALGGDGWAYDIGYGGLDHVLASGEDINVLVFDTEVYSNTGGQASKATPEAAIAKFAASGKKIKKKDLGMMAVSYGYVYVAQVAMGSDKNQFMKAVIEAESYKGPSIIICYAPCINHGIRKGMGKTQENAHDAVASGYWQLWRHNPLLKEKGENPFVLDSREPTMKFRDFILGQVRYSSLLTEFPKDAERLFAASEEDAKERLEGYKKLAGK